MFGFLNYYFQFRDPPLEDFGPGIWTFQNQFRGRFKAFIQKNMINTDIDVPLGTIAYLNNKFCVHGQWQFDFYAHGEGSVGAVFHYENEANFYILDIFGGQEQKVTLRKRLNGQMTTLSQNQNMGYKIQQWYSVRIVLNDHKFQVYMALVGKENLKKVFPVPVWDRFNQVKGGTVGLTTTKTKAGFDKILLSPEPTRDLVPDHKPKLDGTFEEDESSSDDEESFIQTNQKSQNVIDENNGEDEQNQDPNFIQMKMKSKKDYTIYQDEQGNLKQLPQAANELQYDKDDKETFDYGVCAVARLPSERAKFCRAHFFMKYERDREVNCNRDFCHTCCMMVIDPIHVHKRVQCERVCVANAKSENEEDLWKACIQSPLPALSSYQYCDAQFGKSYIKNHCQLDFCKLCCFTRAQQIHIMISDSSVATCYKACYLQFYESDFIMMYKEMRIPNPSYPS